MKKRVLSAFLALTMAASVAAGCGNSSGGEENASSSSDTSTSQEVIDLKMCMYSFGTNVNDSDMVVERINEYIEPLIGVNIEIEWISVADWSNQINLKLSAGEQIDLLAVFGTSIDSLYTKGGMTELNDLIESYGSGITEVIDSEYLQAGYINGSLYTIPSIQFWGKNMAFYYRTDIAEKYSLDFSGVETLEDLEQIFETIHASEPDLYCIAANGPTYTLLQDFGWDTLGDDYGVLMNPEESLTVENLFESEEYAQMVQIMYDWYQKGYVQVDAATTTDDIPTIFSTGKAFGTFGNVDPTTIANGKTSMGYDMDYVILSDPLATTSTVQTANWCIPSTTVNAQKAMEFLNLLYTDATLQNLLNYGIEGQHYQVTDSEQGIISFLDGQDFSTTTYYPSIVALSGNSTIAYIWDTDPVTIREDKISNIDESRKSKALGFTFDSSSVINELTALETVEAKYRKGLESGSLDPSTELPKFIEELKNAGIEKVIEAKQAQLDEWASANGIQ